MEQPVNMPVNLRWKVELLSVIFPQFGTVLPGYAETDIRGCIGYTPVLSRPDA